MPLKVPENEEALLDWCRTVVEDAREQRRGQEALWWEQLCVYSGDLWVEFNPHSKRLEELPKPEHRIRLPINLVSPVVRTEYAKLLKNKPIVDCIPESGEQSAIEASKMGNKLIQHYVEKNFKMPRIRREALMWALTCGLGAIFVDYDDSASEEVEVMLDTNRQPVFDPAQVMEAQAQWKDKHQKPKKQALPQGELRIKALGPMQWGWDFATSNPDDAAWCFVTEIYDALVVKRRWGADVEMSDDIRPNMLEQRVLERVDFTGTFRSGSGFKPTSQDLVVIHRLFVKPGHFYFPEGAEIIFTDRELIEATSYPFGHGRLPVSGVGHIPMPGSRFPLSIVSQVRDPVLEISKTESQLVENRNLMGNPPWIEYHEHNIPEDKLVNKPGMRIKIPFRPNMNDPHPVDMPEMPSYIQDLPDRLEAHVQTIAGQGETSQGKVPPGARSGVAIAYLQEEDDTKLGPTVLEFEEMIENVSWQILRLMAENYELPRTDRISKPGVDPEVVTFTGTMLGSIAAVEVQAGSALPRSKAARQQFTMDLFSMGIEQDPDQVRQELELGSEEPSVYQLAMAQADRENFKMANGQAQNVEDWMNHQAHVARHRRFMMSKDFEALPPQGQQIFRDHDALHQKYLTGIAAAQGMGVPTPGQDFPPAQGGMPAGSTAPPQGGGLPTNGSAPDQMNTQPQ